MRHRLRQYVRLALHQCRHILFQPLQKIRVAQQSIFDNFRHAGRKFFVGQCVQRGQISQYQLRLVKRTNHIFAQRMVNRRFAAHRRINLAQQCGRYLNERDSALICRCGETRHVANHATAQRKDGGLAVCVMR